MQSMLVVVAGLAVRIDLDGEGDCAAFASRLAPFSFAANADPDCAAAPPGDLLALRLHSFSAPAPDCDKLRVSRDGEGHACAGDGIKGRIGARAGELSVHGGEAGLVAALRLACALWLAPRGGLLLHGACARIDGGAHAFLGASGAGKTTLSGRLAGRGLGIVSDEVTAVRFGRAFGQPFQSKLGDGVLPREGLPLRAISILAHAQTGCGPSHRPLRGALAARAIFARIFLPARDPQTLRESMHGAAELARAAPLAELFLPDDDRAADAAIRVSATPEAQVRQ